MKIQEREFEMLENICGRYYELIMAVEKKHPGESRHQTALRFIKESQWSSNNAMHSDQADHAVCSHCGCNPCDCINAYA